MFGDHGLCGLLEEGAHEKFPKCPSGNLGDFGEFCKGLTSATAHPRLTAIRTEYPSLPIHPYPTPRPHSNKLNPSPSQDSRPPRFPYFSDDPNAV